MEPLTRVRVSPRAYRRSQNASPPRSLVGLLLSRAANPLAEHVVRPALVDQDERDEDQRDDRHDRQCVVRGSGAATVRLFAKSVLETITRGKRLVKSVTTTAIVARPVIANALIWLRRRAKTTASMSAAIPITAGSTGGNTSLSFRSTATTTVQIRNTVPSAAATSESRRAARPARSSRSPWVRKVR